ncbi:MAG TPA: hypothetical protein VG675_20540 [Bryobacteraceae bacterium]|nr:hypothetical protein [Bryobacteraceae bacterium]
MFFRPRRFPALSLILIAGCCADLSCSRQAVQPALESFAVLRFENLSPGAAPDWMGRAFSEVIISELTGVKGIYAISSSRLHSYDRLLGGRPISAPGISAERPQAIAAGAMRVAYGQYTVHGAQLDARLTVEDARTGKMTRVVTASSEAGDVITAASELARKIAPSALPYGTRNAEALRLYVAAIESTDPSGGADLLDKAVAADPDFGQAYLALAEWKAQHQDRAGALATLDQGLARGAISGPVRARMELDAASLHGDFAGEQRALAALASSNTADPAAWRSFGQDAFNRHQYTAAMDAYRHILQAQPDDVAALNQLGYAAAYAGDSKSAEAAVRRYQQLRPADVNALDSLGDVNLISGRTQEAAGFYVEASKKDSQFEAGTDLYKASVARLMTGDIAGADALHRQYIDGRNAAHDPLADFRAAQWLWLSGRRGEGYRQMESFAQGMETGGNKSTASRTYSQLAVWSLALGQRAAAAQMADKATQLADSQAAPIAAVAHFLAQPPASASEWSARAERTFPEEAQASIKNFALAYALLLNREFQPASLQLKQMYDEPSFAADPGLPVLLAWSYVESGQDRKAEPLLRFNPVPSSSGPGPFTCLYFPRLFYLRGLAASRQDKQADARSAYQLFLKLSGSEPLMWGDEQKARAMD